jgi:hypothetical protein
VRLRDARGWAWLWGPKQEEGRPASLPACSVSVAGPNKGVFLERWPWKSASEVSGLPYLLFWSAAFADEDLWGTCVCGAMILDMGGADLWQRL